MEILILMIGLFVFFESDSKDINTTKKIETDHKQKPEFVTLKDKVINQELRFEIINKRGIWMFAPVQKNEKQKTAKAQSETSRFITLPDGSKIEKGI